MDLDKKYTPQEAATMTGMDIKKINNASFRGYMVVHRDAVGRGHHVRFSWFNIMELAIAHELQALGLSSVKDAFAAAVRFSHTSDGGIAWEGDDALQDDDPHRWPGLPYHHELGETFLYVAGEKSSVQLVKDGKIDLATVALALGRPAGFIAVNVGEVFERIIRRMGLHPLKVLDEIYGK